MHHITHLKLTVKCYENIPKSILVDPLSTGAGDTAITDRHSDTTIFQLRAHWVRISWSVGSEKIVHCILVHSSTLYVERVHLSSWGCRVYFVTFILFLMENTVSKLCRP